MTFALSAFRSHDDRMAQVRRIRDVVFCQEQGVSPAEEWDGRDGLCEHFLVSRDGIEIGCARVRPYSPGVFKIERVAVLKSHRGTGAGKFIMRALLERLDRVTVVLNAQLSVKDFYQNLGFIPEGDIFQEAGIPHVHMTLPAKPASP